MAKPEKHSKLNWVKKVVTFTAVTSISLANSFASLVNHAGSGIPNGISGGFTNSKSTELKLSNDVMVYEN